MSGETKENRFVRVAEKRTNRVLKDIDLLGNCSNKSNYAYTDEQIEKIFKAIDKAVEEMKQRYKLQEDKGEFKL